MSIETLSSTEEAFEKYRQMVGLFLGPALFIFLMMFPPAGLEPAAAKLSAVMALTLVWWMCEPVPIPITALLAPSLCVALGIADAKKVMASFGDPIVFIFIGGFMLAEAMMVHRLDRRMALGMLGMRWVGGSVRRMIFAFGLIAAALSMWLSNTATTAMLVPIALGLIGEVRELMARQTGQETPGRLNIATALLLILAYGASIGGIGTPIGSPPNLIGIGMIRDLGGVEISFLRWMVFAMPLVVVMFLTLYFLLMFLHKPEVNKLEGLEQYLDERVADLGPWTRGQRNSLIAFGVAVVLWVGPGLLALLPWEEVATVAKRYTKLVPEGLAAIFAATLLFVLPVNLGKREFTLNWKQAQNIDWGTILLFGGGIALGNLAFDTGLAAAIGQGILKGTGLTGVVPITALAIFLGIIVSETTSNTASATMVVPVAIGVAREVGVDPLAPAMGACVGASLGFMLPVSTPPNAIVYGTGLLPITRMVRAGVIFDLIGWAVVLATIFALKDVLV